MQLDLYYFQPLATNSARVFLALLEKGVNFTEHAMFGPHFDHLKPAYLAINPKGQVPTLVCDGDVLTEGMLINEYIDEAFDGPALRPADPLDRFAMRRWCSYAENDLGRAVMMINWNRVVPDIAGNRAPEEMEKLLARSSMSRTRYTSCWRTCRIRIAGAPGCALSARQRRRPRSRNRTSASSRDAA